MSYHQENPIECQQRLSLQLYIFCQERFFRQYHWVNPGTTGNNKAKEKDKTFNSTG